jgi:hypothetical protein
MRGASTGEECGDSVVEGTELRGALVNGARFAINPPKIQRSFGNTGGRCDCFLE